MQGGLFVGNRLSGARRRGRCAECDPVAVGNGATPLMAIAKARASGSLGKVLGSVPSWCQWAGNHGFATGRAGIAPGASPGDAAGRGGRRREGGRPSCTRLSAGRGWVPLTAARKVDCVIPGVGGGGGLGGVVPAVWMKRGGHCPGGLSRPPASPPSTGRWWV